MKLMINTEALINRVGIIETSNHLHQYGYACLPSLFEVDALFNNKIYFCMTILCTIQSVLFPEFY